SGARLTRADLCMANLSCAGLCGTNLSMADLRMADLCGADLWEVDLREANLREADLRLARLVEANLNGATLTDVRLWDSQRARWSIQGINCEAVYWGQDKRDRTLYSPGEFERLFADKTKIVLHYEGGIGRIEIATLPSLMQRIEAAHPGCILRLDSVQDA